MPIWRRVWRKALLRVKTPCLWGIKFSSFQSQRWGSSSCKSTILQNISLWRLSIDGLFTVAEWKQVWELMNWNCWSPGSTTPWAFPLQKNQINTPEYCNSNPKQSCKTNVQRMCWSRMVTNCSSFREASVRLVVWSTDAVGVSHASSTSGWSTSL